MKQRLGATDRLYPMPVPLVVGGSGDTVDALPVAWIGIASATPPSVGMALRRTRRTLELIADGGEFTVNVPSVSLAAQVDYFGLVSGRQRDKFADTGLTLTSSAIVRTPIIEQCPYNMECRVTTSVEMGEYLLVVGEVVETHANEEVLGPAGDKVDIDKLDPLVYLAGVREYRGLSPKVADAFSVGRTVAPPGAFGEPDEC